MEHCVLRSPLGAQLFNLQSEVAKVDPLQGVPILNEKFPSIGRKFDSYHPVQFFGKHKASQLLSELRNMLASLNLRESPPICTRTL